MVAAAPRLTPTLSELSLCTTWHITRHVACDMRSMRCTWFAHDCTRATWAYVLETAAQWGGCIKSQTVALNTIIIIVIIWKHYTLLTLHSKLMLSQPNASTHSVEGSPLHIPEKPDLARGSRTQHKVVGSLLTWSWQLALWHTLNWEAEWPPSNADGQHSRLTPMVTSNTPGRAPHMSLWVGEAYSQTERHYHGCITLQEGEEQTSNLQVL